MSGIFVRDPYTMDGQRVIGGQAQVHATTETEAQQATHRGLGININTGFVTLSTGSTAMLYVANNDKTVLSGDRKLSFHPELLVVAFKEGTFTGAVTVTVRYGDDAGNLVTDANPVAIKSNQQAGAPEPFTDLLCYTASASGKAVSGGADHAVFAMSGSTTTTAARLVAPFPWEVPQGQTISVTVDAPITGTVECYVALVGYYGT